MTRNKNGGIKAMLALFIAMFVLLAAYLVYVIAVSYTHIRAHET